jgi:hypothetical protein
MDENEVPDWMEAEHEEGKEPFLEYPPADASESPPQDSDNQDDEPTGEWGDWWEVGRRKVGQAPRPGGPLRSANPSPAESSRRWSRRRRSVSALWLRSMIKSEGRCSFLRDVLDQTGPIRSAAEMGDSVHVVYVGNRVSSLGRRYRTYEVRLTRSGARRRLGAACDLRADGAGSPPAPRSPSSGRSRRTPARPTAPRLRPADRIGEFSGQPETRTFGELVEPDDVAGSHAQVVGCSPSTFADTMPVLLTSATT